MSIADIKSGGWTLNERLTSAQMNSARAELIKCVDGVGGGTYTPSATVSITDLEVGGTNQLKYGSRTVTRPCIRIGDGTSSDATRWSLSSSASARPHFITLLTGTVYLWFPVRLPVGATLTAVTVYVIGGSGHGSLPFNMPEAEVYSSALGSTSVTSLGSGVDASATVLEYEAGHTIDVTVASHVVLATNNYWLRIRPEGGAGEEVGFIVGGATATLTMTAQDEWT